MEPKGIPREGVTMKDDDKFRVFDTFVLTALLVLLPACGHKKKIKAVEHAPATTTPASSEDVEKAETDEGEKKAEGDATDAGTTVVPAAVNQEVTIDGASAEETAIVKQCLAKFPDNPFAGHVTVFRKIVPLPSFNEDKVTVDDSTISATPAMILITDGLNVGGNIIFKLLDPNGFYCIKPAAMVKNLIIQLDCKARIADANDQKGQGGLQGIYISSVTKIEKVDPGRGDCVR
jgi:hypothetical protein